MTRKPKAKEKESETAKVEISGRLIVSKDLHTWYETFLQPVTPRPSKKKHSRTAERQNQTSKLGRTTAYGFPDRASNHFS